MTQEFQVCMFGFMINVHMYHMSFFTDAKTKTQISCAVSAQQLISAFLFPFTQYNYPFSS